ncbi:MAG: VIT domain-containing protein, partial [Myxococcota bacterium]
MTCDHVDDALTDLLDGTADPALVRHVETCARCAASLAALRRVEQLVRAAGDDALGVEVLAERTAPVPVAPPGSGWTKPARVAVGLGVAGALAAAAAVAVVGLRSAPGAWSGAIGPTIGAGVAVCAPDCRPAGPGDAVPVGATVTTDAASRAEVALADGTTLVLDRGTSVALDRRRSRSARVDTGRIRADVAHVDGTTARLSVPTGDVTVLGTELVVGSIGALGEVAVTRGAVSVAVPGASEPIRVSAGQVATLGVPRPEATARAGWDDLPTVSDQPEDTIRGIGELRARRPGASTEQAAPLRLARHHATIRASGPVAVVEVDEQFANDGDDVLEGIYRFAIPTDAAIESLVLEVDGQPVEGAFTPRARARAIWSEVVTDAKPIVRDGITWYKDPALLEWQRGGRFELRIFPIPAHGSRRVVVRYTVLAPDAGGTRRLQVPLPAGGAPIDDFALTVSVVGHDPAVGVQARGYPLDGAETDRWRGGFAAPSFVPTGDLVLAWALPERDARAVSWAYVDPAPRTLPDGVPPALDPRDPFVAIAVRPRLPVADVAAPRRTVVVVDRSRSMAGERWARATALAAEIAARVDDGDDAVVLACDVGCELAPGGPFSGGPATRTAVAAALAAQTVDGGSDPVAAIAAAIRVATASSLSGGTRIETDLANDPPTDRAIDVVW